MENWAFQNNLIPFQFVLSIELRNELNHSSKTITSTCENNSEFAKLWHNSELLWRIISLYLFFLKEPRRRDFSRMAISSEFLCSQKDKSEIVEAKILRRRTAAGICWRNPCRWRNGCCHCWWRVGTSTELVGYTSTLTKAAEECAMYGGWIISYSMLPWKPIM